MEASPQLTANFLCTIVGLIPAIRDRDSGIWQKVFLSATGPVESGTTRHHYLPLPD